MSDVQIPGGYVAGMTWGWVGRRGTWTGPEAERSMDLMVSRLAVTWTAITFAAIQDTPQSTTIRWREQPTVSDDEVRSAIRAAKARGLHVVLKPVVNVANGTWRAHIDFFSEDVPGEPTWGDWFAAYTEFLVHHARIAADEGVEMLCIGCEMVQSDRREAQWRALIAEVRAVYGGLLTYNCDKYQEDRLTWWDAVDVMSSSGYYPIDEWDAQLDRIGGAVARAGKPFFFMEAGCPSRTGSARRPNDWAQQGTPSGQEQADWYRATFDACGRRPWVRGFMLWDWPARLYDEAEAPTNDDYCVFGKPAEAVVREAYLDAATASAGG